MTEDVSLDQYFESLTSSKILIGVLNEIKTIEIPVSFFSNVPDSQLEVGLNENQTNFIFSLREDNSNK